MHIMVLDSEQATIALGESLGERLRPGDLLFLSGDPGAGKTTLTQGIARGLGVTVPVTSPTFQLKKSYTGRFRLVHLDLYRLERPEELEVLEPDELTSEGITVVEWGDLLKQRLALEYLEIRIDFGPAGGRTATFTPSGGRYHDLVKELAGC